MTLPTNIKIDPITTNPATMGLGVDLGDLGSIGTYRTNNTLNQIENRVLRNLTARNKQLASAIKQDPTTPQALMLALGSGLQEQSTNRQLNDLRMQVRGGDIRRARAKSEKTRRDNNIREVNSIIKDIAPNLKGRVDPGKLAEQFGDPNTGGINYQEVGNWLTKESSAYEQTRPISEKEKNNLYKDLENFQRIINENPSDPELQAGVRTQMQAIRRKLKLPVMEVTFEASTSPDLWVKDSGWFEKDEGHYNSSLKITVDGEEIDLLIDPKGDKNPYIKGNMLVIPSMEDPVSFEPRKIRLNSKAITSFRNALKHAKGIASQKFNQPQEESVLANYWRSFNTPPTAQASGLIPPTGQLLVPPNFQPNYGQGGQGQSPVVGQPPVVGQSQTVVPQSASSPVTQASPQLKGKDGNSVAIAIMENNRAKNQAYLDKNKLVGGVDITQPTNITPGDVGDLIGLENIEKQAIASEANATGKSYLEVMKEKNPEAYAKAMAVIASGERGDQYTTQPGAVQSYEGNILPDTPITEVPLGDGSNLTSADMMANIGNTPSYDAMKDRTLPDPRIVNNPMWNTTVQADPNYYGMGGVDAKPSYNIKLAKELDAKWPLKVPKPTAPPQPGDPTTIGNQDMGIEEESFSAWVWHPELNEWKQHGASIDPRTGEVLKDRNHPTFHLTEKTEKELGNKIVERNGKLYSEPDKKEKAKKIDQPGQPMMTATLDRNPSPNAGMSAADAEELQRIARGEPTIAEVNAELTRRQMARANQRDPQTDPLDEIRNVADNVVESVTSGPKNAVASIRESFKESPKPKEKVLSDEQKRNLERTALQNVRGKPVVDERSWLGKAYDYLGNEFNKEGERVRAGASSVKNEVVKQAKDFMKYKGFTGKSGNEAMDWVRANAKEFEEWRKSIYGPKVAEGTARSRAESKQAKAKGNPDERYLVALARKTGDRPLPEDTPILNNVKRGLSQGRANIKNVRPGFLVALIKAENQKFDPNAEGKEMDKNAKLVKGGKVQGLGLAQVTANTAKGTPIGKSKFKGMTNKEVADKLKKDPDLNVAVAAQFVEQLHTKFKKNQYTKNWSKRDFELLLGTAYNNRGESFDKVINKVKPKNFKDLLNRAGNYSSGAPVLEKQTRRLINRLEKSLNEYRSQGGSKVRPSGKKIPKTFKEKLLAPFEKV